MEAVIDFTSGVMGGTACVYVGQPLDTIKVKMQMFPNLYKNAFSCGIETFRKDGIYRGLYAGTIPALSANIAENAVLFMSYGLCQKAICKLSFKDKVEELNSFHNALAGSSAAFFASLVLCPTELVKCRLQSARELSNSTNIGPYRLCRQIFMEQGIRGFYHGLASTFAREMPGYFFFFGAYEFTRSLFASGGKSKDDIGIMKTALCGGIGGVSFWVSIFPTDVIKSRVQIDPNGPIAKKSVLGGMKHIFETEGLLKLYSGLGPSIIRSFFATGALFVTVNETKKFLTNFF
ncbi:mitochondrial ornithine transporter 1 [Brachionus plicatilis]|uniref:Mitochondrial ornithine transporter 1 n=1 Tax=Brachionus plicatilis TaxID=10195 RepID=A0A3M7PII5_BRAPC|nr:mitochondrial ornithine transporter 1 [Brachionus plicatilis]